MIDDHLFLPTSRFIRKAKKYSVKARSTFQYNDAKMQPSKCQVPELSFLYTFLNNEINIAIGTANQRVEFLCQSSRLNKNNKP